MSVQFNGQVKNSQQVNKILKTLQTNKGAKTQKAPGMGMNDSIFNLVSNNQTRANSAQPTMRKPASAMAKGVSGTGNTSPAGNVVGANTKASVDDIQGTKPKTQSTSVADINSGKVPDEFQKVEVGNVDFNNLTCYSEAQLQSLKHDLKQELDNDCPFFLRVPFEAKLNKVESELKTRAEQSGNRVDEEKDDKKSNESITSDAKSGATTAKAGAAEAQRGTTELNNMSSKSSEIGKDLKSAQAKMEKQEAAGQKEVNKNIKLAEKENETIARLNEENELLSTEIEEANAEIEAASAEIENSQPAAARTRSVAGGESENIVGAEDSGTPADTSKIDDLQTKVQTANAKLSVNSVKISKSTVAIHKYQTANNKTVRTLTKANKSYVKTVNQAQQQLQANEIKQSGLEETLNKINDVSSKVALAGTVAKYIGMGLSKTGWPPTVAVGVYMEATGVIAETAGNYGVAAANVGLAASNVAKGNIMGAVINAGTAFMAGASAVNNTKQIASAVKAGGAAAAEKAGKAGKELIQSKLKDEAGNVVAKEVQNKGINSVANSVASTVGKPKLMEVGSTLMNAASVFAKKDDGTQGVQQQKTASRGAIHSRRRKIA